MLVISWVKREVKKWGGKRKSFLGGCPCWKNKGSGKK